MRAYGNMTSVEKEINKGELLAWKNYDSGQVAALVPGASNAVPRYPQKNPSPQPSSPKGLQLNEDKIMK